MKKIEIGYNFTVTKYITVSKKELKKFDRLEDYIMSLDDRYDYDKDSCDIKEDLFDISENKI